jgi:hypothetical protein
MMAIVSPGVAPPAAAEGAAAPPAYLARKTTDSRAKNARIRARYNPPVIPSPRQSPYCDPPTSIKYSLIATISGSIHPTGFPCALHQPSRHHVRFFATASGLLSSVGMAYEMPMCGTSRRAVGPTTGLAGIICALAAPYPIDVAPPSPSAAAATTAQSTYARATGTVPSQPTFQTCKTRGRTHAPHTSNRPGPGRRARFHCAAQPLRELRPNQFPLRPFKPG